MYFTNGPFSIHTFQEYKSDRIFLIMKMLSLIVLEKQNTLPSKTYMILCHLATAAYLHLFPPALFIRLQKSILRFSSSSSSFQPQRFNFSSAGVFLHQMRGWLTFPLTAQVCTPLDGLATSPMANIAPRVLFTV